IPYGTAVTVENVKTVEVGEEAIRALGFRQFRVRFHGELVRLEIAPDERARVDSRNGAGVCRDLQAARISLRHHRSGRLPARLTQFSPDRLRSWWGGP